jgi:hypothetical protein
MSTENLRDRLASLEVVLTAESDGIEGALAQLAGLVDPESFRRRIALLVQLGRPDEAVHLVAARSPEPEWLEAGLRAAVLAGNLRLAQQLVHQSVTLSDSTGTLPLRASNALANSALEKHASSFGSTSRRSRYAVEPTTRKVLEDGATALTRFGDTVVARRSIASPLEREAMTALVKIRALLGRGGDTISLLQILVRSRPVDLDLGSFVLDGKLPRVSGLAEAIYESFPGDFFGRLFQILLRDGPDQNEPAGFYELSSLKPLAVSLQERAVLADALSEFGRRSPESVLPELEGLLRVLLDLSTPEHRVVLANHERRYGRIAEARGILATQEMHAHPYYMWVMAQCLLMQGETDSGITLLVQAATTAIDEGWLIDASERAYRRNRPTDSINCLKHLRDYYPWLINGRRNLARLLLDAGYLQDAIDELLYLSEQLPAEPALKEELGRAYLQNDQPQEALEALGPVKTAESLSLRTLLLISLALRSLDRPKDGFSVLHAYREQFWAEKDFLLAYLEFAYASESEAAATEALNALNTLREQGKIDPREFRLTSLDEVLQLTRDQQERYKTALQSIARGQVPWTTCAELFRRPLILDWMSRTQELRWLAEDSTTRAEYSIYATNGFAIDVSESERQIAQIEAAPSGIDICVDYSALLTLHSLGQLDLLFSTYRVVVIPSDYRFSVLNDIKRLQPHQLSQRSALEMLDELVARNTLRVYDDDNKDFPRVDEYSDPADSGRQPHPLAALADTLRAAGQLDKESEHALNAIQVRTADRDKQARVEKGERIGIALPTLLTLYRTGLLDSVVSTFNVHISKADSRDLDRDLRSFRLRDFARTTLRAMWDLIEQQQNVEFVPTEPEAGQERHYDAGLSLSSMQVAQDRGLPLLADDRALQAVITNSRATASGSAFGTDALLRARREAGALSIEQYSKSVIRLMRWRYRFVIPSSEMLHHLASRYAGSAPGAELAFVAEYAHDCMRDPGLLGGLENSTPPTSMALRLFMRWTSLIGEFLSLIWVDDSLSDDRVEHVTDWAAQVMVPMVPMSIKADMHSRMAALVRESTVVYALISLGQARQHARAAANLRRMARQLGVPEQRLMQLIAEVVARVSG